MKKLINKPENVENEMLNGIAKAHPEYVKRVEGFDVLVRSNKKEGKVARRRGRSGIHLPHPRSGF